MSKKLAEGAGTLVLDVKWGKGAFMKTLAEARKLARTMVEIGTRMKREMTAVITDMNQPLGKSVGNSVEIIETIQALKGSGPDDLMRETIELSALMLTLSGRCKSRVQAVKMLNEKIVSGEALEKFREMVRLHGGKTAFIENHSLLPKAKYSKDLFSHKSGYVSEVDANLVGRACLVLGAGRSKTTDTIDHASGITDIVKIGDRIGKGTRLLTLFSNDRKKLNEACKLASCAVKTSNHSPSVPRLIVETILP